jgi:hypothetical protein
MQGVLSLWRGHTATLLHRIPYSAVNFAVFENSKILLAPYLKNRSEGGSYVTEVRFRCSLEAQSFICALMTVVCNHSYLLLN